MENSKLARYAPYAASVLRIVSGITFLQSGGMKLFGWFGGMPGGQTLDLFSQVGLAGILEFAGGILIVLGLFTRPVAFILSGEMAVAYFQAHFPNGFWPIQNHGLSSVLYCFIFLFFFFYGGRGWSLDNLIWSRKKKVQNES